MQLNSDHQTQGEDLLQHIPSLLTGEESDCFDQFPAMEEIQRVIEYMDANSCSGPNGFNEFFFKTY